MCTPASLDRRVVDDGGIAGTLGYRTVQGKFYGIGGEAFTEKIRVGCAHTPHMSRSEAAPRLT